MLEIRFTPESIHFVLAANEYSRIWLAEGARIVSAIEENTTLAFSKTHVESVV